MFSLKLIRTVMTSSSILELIYLPKTPTFRRMIFFIPCQIEFGQLEMYEIVSYTLTYISSYTKKTTYDPNSILFRYWIIRKNVKIHSIVNNSGDIIQQSITEDYLQVSSAISLSLNTLHFAISNFKYFHKSYIFISMIIYRYFLTST